PPDPPLPAAPPPVPPPDVPADPVCMSPPDEVQPSSAHASTNAPKVPELQCSWVLACFDGMGGIVWSVLDLLNKVGPRATENANARKVTTRPGGRLRIPTETSGNTRPESAMAFETLRRSLLAALVVGALACAPGSSGGPAGSAGSGATA